MAPTGRIVMEVHAVSDGNDLDAVIGDEKVEYRPRWSADAAIWGGGADFRFGAFIV